MRKEFIEAIKTHQAAFKISLGDAQFERLADYYDLISEHNPILHLVAPMPPEEFAVRHILESLTMLEYLPKGSRFADVGTGGGLPSIPCLLVRGDLRAVLIESKEKKARFLELAANALGISARTTVTNKQFQEADPANAETITCRALDKFSEKLPGLLRWRKSRQMLLFGGPSLREALTKNKAVFIEKLMPMSEQRYLFVVNR